jgi:hypothetical protein
VNDLIYILAATITVAGLIMMYACVISEWRGGL